MLLRNLGQMILIIVSVATDQQLQNCVHFEKESGFIKLAERSVIEEHSVISLEFKAYNCDRITLRFHNGENYVQSFHSSDGVFALTHHSCNGLWNKGYIVLHNHFDLNVLLDSFKDHPLYLGILPDNDFGSNYDKPFEGFLGNINVNGQPLTIDLDNLNGTLVVRDCRKALQFSKKMGSVQLFENFNFIDNIDVYFELKITNLTKCSALLLSAFSEDDDSYFIVEIIKKNLYMKTKSQDRINVSLLFVLYTELCDGYWHKIALRQRGNKIKMMVDSSVYENNSGFKLNFTAPLYIGRHPHISLIPDIENCNGFKGYLRSFQMNKVTPEISADDINKFVKFENCFN